jgi:K+-transporting ATPase ATPase C chain
MTGYLLTSLRLCIGTILICVVAYAAFVWSAAAVIAPEARQGSLIVENGAVVGSSLVAQEFTRPEYFWPRPSAAKYDAAAAAGSNLSPANAELRARAEETAARLGATAETKAPADLVAASGSGLDPHISLEGALFQAPRVAAARQIDETELQGVIDGLVERPAGGPGLVNVLRLNIALDRRFQAANR